MARHYARFDGGTEATLDSDYFEQCKVSDGSTAATNLKNGLIDSRSLVTTDIYQDLDSVNQNGSLGIYFPPNSGPFSTDYSTYASWSTAYTSSLDGIKTPTSNTYGGGGINYSLRPTASILSTDTTVVGPTNPADSVGISYSTYLNASNAVTDVLNSIRSGSDTVTNRGPYARLGNERSRTLHSIWHNPTLTYFAWDDFTPAAMSTNGLDIQVAGADCNQSPSPGAVSTIQFTWSNTLSYVYKNDGNPSGKIGIEIEVAKASGATGTCDTNWNVPRFRLQLGYSATANGGPLILGTATSSNGPNNPSTATSPGNCTGVSTWTWNGYGGYAASGTPNLTWTVKLEDCISPGYDITVSTKLYDAIITTSTNGGTAGIIAEQAAIPNTA